MRIFFRRVTLLELIVIATVLIVTAAIVLPFMQQRDRGHPPGRRCLANLKGIGQALALYTDCGAKPFPATFRPLIDGNYLVSELIQCPMNDWDHDTTGDPDLGDYAYRMNPRWKNSEHTFWLVRDCYEADGRGSARDNGHEKVNFYFLHTDMNFVGDQDDWATFIDAEKEQSPAQ